LQPRHIRAQSPNASHFTVADTARCGTNCD
jgi:hypothetical protein